MSGTYDKPADGVFEGFSSPQFTQTPNVFFDRLMPDLGEAELKVLLYIIRRTWGFAGKQGGDAISLNQLCNGITNERGEQLDRGTGLAKGSVARALVSLRAKGIITRIKNRDATRGDLPTTYRLRMLGEPLDVGAEPVQEAANPVSLYRDTPVSQERHPLSPSGDTPVSDQRHPVSATGDTQKKDEQQKVNGKTDFENSIGDKPKINYSATRMALQPYLADLARELNDQATLSASLSRAVNLCELSGLEVDEFIDVMLEARAATQERSASITKKAPGGGWEKKNKMPYFFEILAERLGVSEKRQAS